MAPEKILLEKGGEQIPLPATVGQYTERRRPSVYRRFAYVFIAVLGLKVLVQSYYGSSGLPNHGPSHGHHRLTAAEREKLFLSVPSSESALAASRAYATHPHLAGAPEDFDDAKVILELFQKEFGISPPSTEPIFPAGSPESRNATLLLTSRETTKPSAWIDTYYPVLNTPLDRSLQILDANGVAVWSADLVEDGDPLDEDAAKYRDDVPTFHGLSKDGDVEGQLVYANYGTKEVGGILKIVPRCWSDIISCKDYESLVAAGADLTGKIVIVRYGGVFRGLKVGIALPTIIKGAEELGAVGVLIYSDPRDDGFVTVENGYAPYPAGPARNPTSVQRGSVQYLSIYPGDPTTPGKPAYKDADREEATNIPTIPSLPISWQNAERLLEEIEGLHGDVLGIFGVKTFRGNLNGKASEAKIKLVNHVDTKVTPIWNTLASIPGHIRDEVVIIGCHRDAWVLGAADPTSGTVSLHEIVRGFGALLRKGWKPLRTVVFASWDGEEYGLVGSTEWGEDFPEWISKHVVAYLNVDVSVSGSQWSASGSPSLAPLIKQAALEIPHPTVEGKTLWDARNDEGPFKGVGHTEATIDPDFLEAYNAAKKELRASDTGVSPLGSGSDFTVFLQRLGIASSDEGFSGTPTDAVYHYHSVYDSQRYQELYADPGFHRHVTVAKHLGLLALRLTDSIIVPLNTTQYALELNDYLAKVEALTVHLPSSFVVPNFKKLQKAITEVQRASLNLDKEKYKAEKDLKRAFRKLRPRHRGLCHKSHRFARRAADWVKKLFGIEPHDYQPVSTFGTDAWAHLLDFDGDEIRESAAILAHPGHRHADKIKKLIKAAKRVYNANKKIIAFERGFISEGGIKDREWYKHLGVAPGKWLGYGATTFPALTEALSIDQNATLAQHEADRLTELLEKLANVIEP
ncbi:hypothetical protein DXG03_000341 [Asterophora parasitica]|uniref:Zn-dependent exopeptidase n=1 Tax=Asterophora parasitica TaxID=117018 RepID=A0A9P7GE97_9AGAR|nr:hypothetical protein DXG03_000341 [Asterophora parasitica]